ncbi:hypothetical protein PVAP13_2NG174703 [Panicum virgatum]|uniref:Uncharacterized protein n=1 Tax=Panicum virgatum TaxID=38727 RepID=A0A8T0VMW6_PANVG|nr:hypothetical protein PVAP13_2NG174703 [Panicum virgatum]
MSPSPFRVSQVPTAAAPPRPDPHAASPSHPLVSRRFRRPAPAIPASARRRSTTRGAGSRSPRRRPHRAPIHPCRRFPTRGRRPVAVGAHSSPLHLLHAAVGLAPPLLHAATAPPPRRGCTSSTPPSASHRRTAPPPRRHDPPRDPPRPVLLTLRRRVPFPHRLGSMSASPAPPSSAPPTSTRTPRPPRVSAISSLATVPALLRHLQRPGLRSRLRPRRLPQPILLSSPLPPRPCWTGRGWRCLPAAHSSPAMTLRPTA